MSGLRRDHAVQHALAGCVAGRTPTADRRQPGNSPRDGVSYTAGLHRSGTVQRSHDARNEVAGLVASWGPPLHAAEEEASRSL
jgi:hypothetical protein